MNYTYLLETEHKWIRIQYHFKIDWEPLIKTRMELPIGNQENLTNTTATEDD